MTQDEYDRLVVGDIVVRTRDAALFVVVEVARGEAAFFGDLIMAKRMGDDGAGHGRKCLVLQDTFNAGNFGGH